MDTETALVAIKNGASPLDKINATRYLSEQGTFYEAAFRRSWNNGVLSWNLESLDDGDRASLPEHIRVFRVADENARAGVHWAERRTYARLHLPFWLLDTPMWQTTLHRDDPRLIAHVRSNGARGEYIVHPDGLDTESATGSLRADLEDITAGVKSSRPSHK
jgi:hypothetical protein